MKCLLGVMADDELGMDLSAVDPGRVVKGEEDVMGVVIMGLAVIAKRRGIDLGRGTTEADRSADSGFSGRAGAWQSEDARDARDVRDEMDVMDQEEDVGMISVDPLEPDITLSSPVVPSVRSPDVFGSFRVAEQNRNVPVVEGLFSGRNAKEGVEGYANGRYGRMGLDENEPYDDSYGNGNIDGRYRGNGHNEAYITPVPRSGFPPLPFLPTDPTYGNEDGYQEEDRASRRIRHALAFDKVSTWREDSQTTLTSSSGGYGLHKTGTTGSSVRSGQRTVLQDMLDEFGLG